MTIENLGREQIGRITGGRSSLARTCLLWIHRSYKTLSLGPPPRLQGDYVITIGISQENGSTILVPLKSDDEVVGRIAVDAVIGVPHHLQYGNGSALNVCGPPGSFETETFFEK